MKLCSNSKVWNPKLAITSQIAQQQITPPRPIGTGVRWRPIAIDPIDLICPQPPPQQNPRPEDVTPRSDNTPLSVGEDVAGDPSWTPPRSRQAARPTGPPMLTRQRARELEQ
ncbi:hypothetical protein L798_04194 [Zootermopsis nevadensis]|uniref:Uncharacterized protein n=1 Tax=Zootermopsis nevadensis TaxID=136037 RepID=A0A067QRQ2_ZOONE|nr:hypothetical protein L798_09710 [Zootermopsis nevadensis]KDR06646.1 hypothetical protein L798_04194 [Zootermopsis nevadensis]